MTDLRGSLVTALEADLIGPFEPGTRDTSTELLPIAPSRWYLTGVLAPQSDRDPHDPTADDELGTGTGDDDDAEPAPEPEPKQKNHFPASMGVSVFLPPAADGVDAATETVRVTICFAEYILETKEVAGSKRAKNFWRRVPQPARFVDIPLVRATVEKGVSLPDTPGIRISGELEIADAPGLPKGTRALALFVVNSRTPGDAARKDEQFIFQEGSGEPSRPGEGHHCIEAWRAAA